MLLETALKKENTYFELFKNMLQLILDMLLRRHNNMEEPVCQNGDFGLKIDDGMIKNAGDLQATA